MKKLNYIKTFESYNSKNINFLYASDILDNYNSIENFKKEIELEDISDDEAIAEFDLENQYHYDIMIQNIIEFGKQSSQFIGICGEDSIGPDSLLNIVKKLISDSERFIIENTKDEVIVTLKDIDKIYRIKSYKLDNDVIYSPEVNFI